ncbi:MAG: NADP-dependent phosphogluconate dehydrogenase [Candidatus Peribacter sp.]|jgi:6-phosphogluconate dehydrogenase|nr:NADP-dependent phosphogluconate dehydrogenase [Candidatus Peribacter sp.]MBT4393539.1 NADP-dependent phosphogluconate dehydrogenase [Candidatus Peribacter sp.]MBT4601244.1 NADP-dependent phosphogluconate dehydrogenase [Candidatus Peribacter sp.]MBT5149293.1 NADP-dependent phosphogluconate dehydrogenase [Candidatus Peribacter sp.]MBT5637117.1 NADP-dependent phosphogluconate dehydrogenase [Candidatus Peribacter sp.]
MSISQLGVIGLGTMGANLARNAARNGAKVAVYNRTTEVMNDFVKDYKKEGMIVPCKTYEELMRSLDTPRAVLLMVKAGPAVDAVIEDLLPHLEEGDIIIDGGNSHYPDSERRVKELKEKGIRFLGMGVSGGEEGALLGPSMMPGGDVTAWEDMKELLEKMAADDGLGGKCVTYIGEGGSGHFVKMVHNGIEYGIMQLIAESYDVLKNIGDYTNAELAETFGHWNKGDDLQSFLIEITAKAFEKKDDQGPGDLIDVIQDQAGQKGTGKWTTISALHYGVAIPTITAAVDARIISGSLDLRESKRPYTPDLEEPVPNKEKMRIMVRSALHLSTLCSYKQGFQLMKVASEEHNWQLNLSECARIWLGGCIIRSVLLKTFIDALSGDSAKEETASQYFEKQFSGEKQVFWRQIQELSASRGIPIPAISASLSYYDAIRRDRLPQNLIQAQRDFFGAHTFTRTDKEGTYHAQWE